MYHEMENIENHCSIVVFAFWSFHWFLLPSASAEVIMLKGRAEKPLLSHGPEKKPSISHIQPKGLLFDMPGKVSNQETSLTCVWLLHKGLKQFHFDCFNSLMASLSAMLALPATQAECISRTCAVFLTQA